MVVGGVVSPVVTKLHFITVDDITNEVGVDTGNSALDVKLADEPGLHDRLGNVVHFD